MNTVAQLKDYFGTEDRPVSAKEMMDFWKDLSEEDKNYYKNADLS